ncbi:hypothetical protein [Salinivibrio costicola]|uniref:hypothetical protein n=1 Tax=Salinivibrio costicola TaxID=51367 RepID=UPI0003958D65|nr:hypothetical protein [Salinivibrio costicola]
MMHYAAWAPVTIGAKFNTGANFDLNVGWRAAHIVIIIGIALALMPTYAYFNINDAIRDWHQFDLRCPMAPCNGRAGYTE